MTRILRLKYLMTLVVIFIFCTGYSGCESPKTVGDNIALWGNLLKKDPVPQTVIWEENFQIRNPLDNNTTVEFFWWPNEIQNIASWRPQMIELMLYEDNFDGTNGPGFNLRSSFNQIGAETLDVSNTPTGAFKWNVLDWGNGKGINWGTSSFFRVRARYRANIEFGSKKDFKDARKELRRGGSPFNQNSSTHDAAAWTITTWGKNDRIVDMERRSVPIFGIIPVSF